MDIDSILKILTDPKTITVAGSIGAIGAALFSSVKAQVAKKSEDSAKDSENTATKEAAKSVKAAKNLTGLERELNNFRKDYELSVAENSRISVLLDMVQHGRDELATELSNSTTWFKSKVAELEKRSHDCEKREKLAAVRVNQLDNKIKEATRSNEYLSKKLEALTYQFFQISGKMPEGVGLEEGEI